MQQTPNEPIYAAKDRVPFNLTLVLALGIAGWGVAGFLGIFPPPANPEMIILLGVAVSIYTWLFTPKEYMVYSDSVCVAYGKPRVKVIHFSNIAVVEMGSMVALDQLRIRPIKGRRQSIRVRDPETFFEALEAALTTYRAEHPDENVDFEVTGRRPPEIVDAGPVAVADEAPATTVEPAAEIPLRSLQRRPDTSAEAEQDAVAEIDEAAEPPVADEAQADVAEEDGGAGDSESDSEQGEGEDPQQSAPRPFY